MGFVLCFLAVVGFLLIVGWHTLLLWFIGIVGLMLLIGWLLTLPSRTWKKENPVDRSSAYEYLNRLAIVRAQLMQNYEIQYAGADAASGTIYRDVTGRLYADGNIVRALAIRKAELIRRNIQDLDREMKRVGIQWKIYAAEVLGPDHKRV